MSELTEQTEKITFDVNLNKNDLIKYSFYVFLHRPVFLIIYAVWLFWVGRNTVIGFKYYDAIPASFWFFIFFLFLFPVLIYWGGVRAYKNNPRLSEKMTYTVDNMVVSIQGDSFNSTYSVDKIYKMKESKSYFYIFTQKHAANIIPKRDLKQTDIDFLNKLKNNIK